MYHTNQFTSCGLDLSKTTDASQQTGNLHLPPVPTQIFMEHSHTQSMGHIQNFGYHQPQPFFTSQHQHSSSFQSNSLPPPPGMSFSDFQTQVQLPVMAPMLRADPILAPVQQHYQQQVEQVNGGVNAVLDYELEHMSEYIIKYAMLAFDVENNSQQDFNNQGVDLFKKAVYSVLNNTRLSTVSIFQALHYLSKYLDKLPEGSKAIGGNSINIVYQNTMIAFILANKFNDDKTFTNKSWSEATGMELPIINEYEKEWLQVFQWRLYDDKFALYEDYVYSYKVFCKSKVTYSPTSIPSIQQIQNPMSNNSNYNCVPINASGFETPVQKYSNLSSSPFYYSDDSSDYYYHNQQNSSLTPMSNVSPPRKVNYPINNFNYYNNFASQTSNNLHVNFPQQPYPAWNVETPTYNSFQQRNSSLFDTYYYNNPAVY